MTTTTCPGFARADAFCYRPEHNKGRPKRPLLSARCPLCNGWIFTTTSRVREDSPHYQPFHACPYSNKCT